MIRLVRRGLRYLPIGIATIAVACSSSGAGDPAAGTAAPSSPSTRVISGEYELDTGFPLEVDGECMVPASAVEGFRVTVTDGGAEVLGVGNTVQSECGVLGFQVEVLDAPFYAIDLDVSDSSTVRVGPYSRQELEAADWTVNFCELGSASGDAEVTSSLDAGADC